MIFPNFRNTNSRFNNIRKSVEDRDDFMNEINRLNLLVVSRHLKVKMDARGVLTDRVLWSAGWVYRGSRCEIRICYVRLHPRPRPRPRNQ